MRDKIDVVDDILSVDGKAIKSTCSSNAKDSALSVLTVYGTASGISFEQNSRRYALPKRNMQKNC